MTKRPNTTHRRDVLAGIGFFAGIAVAVPAIASVPSETAEDAEWREFIEGMAWAHPNGRTAAELAREHGMDLAEFSGATLHGEGGAPEDWPVLTFGDIERDGHCVLVSPRQCGEYRRVRRGSDPDLTDDLRKMGLLGKAVG